jgi:hypothetical protein
VLTSDPSDPTSYANKQSNSGYHDLAAAFDFNTEGTVMREPALEAQSKASTSTTATNYLRQTMESEAGDNNEGVRLALYFVRKAPGVTDIYGILGDKALLQVAQTALGISSSTSAADIDVQAKMLTKQLKVADLKDPAKLNQFLVRFCAMYDMNNATSDTSATSILFGDASQGATIGFDQSLISSFQNLKIGLF